MRKKYIEIAAVMVIFVILAAISDLNNKELSDDYEIQRDAVGGSSREMELVLNADGIEKDYVYKLEVEAQKLAPDQINDCLQRAKEEIDNTVFGDEEANYVTKDLVIKEEYASGLVEADWSFSDYKLIDFEGTINRENISAEGSLVQADVELSCQGVEEDYDFSFVIYPKDLSGDEELLKNIDEDIEKKMDKSGEALQMPKELNGISLNWAEKKSHTAIKVIVFELVICILLKLVMVEKKHQAKKKREILLKLDYSDIVSKMAILVGSGMTIKESWNRIATQNAEKGQEMLHPAYQEMLLTVYEIKDGISEKIAYQRFGERTGLGEYNRFARSLIQNLQKGNRGICDYLEKEAELAFEEKKLMAKKIGEEAGTKLLGPLLLMMGIVIAIVIVPAMVSFTI